MAVSGGGNSPNGAPGISGTAGVSSGTGIPIWAAGISGATGAPGIIGSTGAGISGNPPCGDIASGMTGCCIAGSSSCGSIGAGCAGIASGIATGSAGASRMIWVWQVGHGVAAPADSGGNSTPAPQLGQFINILVPFHSSQSIICTNISLHRPAGSITCRHESSLLSPCPCRSDFSVNSAPPPISTIFQVLYQDLPAFTYDRYAVGLSQ